VFDDVTHGDVVGHPVVVGPSPAIGGIFDAIAREMQNPAPPVANQNVARLLLLAALALLLLLLLPPDDWRIWISAGER